MHKLRCIVVDDEPLQRILLSDYIQKTPFLQLAGVFENPLEALTAVQQQPIDLIFLDIQMPELSGIQFMQLLEGRSKVIFISAYPNYALQGFELDVADYLLKPVSFERFLKAATRVLNEIQPHTPTNTPAPTDAAGPIDAPIPAGSPVPADPAAEKVLFVKTDYKIVKIVLDDVLYIEGLKEYITIHLPKDKVITLQTIKKMEEVLPGSRFVRVHRSFIIAIDKIDFIERNRVFIKGASIPIGETYKDSFLLLLNSRNLL